jgi:predicted component of type VI protein secretion system
MLGFTTLSGKFIQVEIKESAMDEQEKEIIELLEKVEQRVAETESRFNAYLLNQKQLIHMVEHLYARLGLSSVPEDDVLNTFQKQNTHEQHTIATLGLLEGEEKTEKMKKKQGEES